MKKTFTLFITLLLSWTVSAQYTLKSSDVKINSSGYIAFCNKTFASDEKDIIIPETINGITIKGIEDQGCLFGGVFKNKGITSVQLPSTIEYIGRLAFRNNPLSSVDFSNCPNLRYIGQASFIDCGIKEINFTGCIKLTNISYFAFDNNEIEGILDLSTCSSLQTLHSNAFSQNKLRKVKINCAALTVIEDDVFRNNQLTEVDLSNCSNLSTIESAAFYGNSISSINFENCSSLKTIGSSVFYGSKLTTIDFSIFPNLTTIGNYSFANNLLESVNLSGLNNLVYLGSNAFVNNKIGTIDLSNCISLKLIGSAAFQGNQITKADLSNCKALTNISNYAFSNNLITTLNLSSTNNIVQLGDYSFATNQLSAINLNLFTKLSSIGENAFEANSISGIQNLSDCSSLSRIGANAFANNSSLSCITLPNEQEWVSSQNVSYNGGTNTSDFLSAYFTFYTLTDDDVVVSNGVITSCSYDFAEKAIIIPETLDGQQITGIADSNNNTNLFKQKDFNYLKLPASIESIGRYAFYKCPLQVLDISACSKLKTINYKAFELCSIKNLDFSHCTALNYLDSYCFNYNSISSVTGLENCYKLQCIGENAFANNSDLNTAILPKITYSNKHSCIWSANSIYLQPNSNGNYEIDNFNVAYKTAYTVLFYDFDKTFLEKDTAIYKATASPTVKPSRSEYTFTGWSPDISNITDTLSVTAQYIRNDADKYIFRIETRSDKPLVFAKITTKDKFAYTLDAGVAILPLVSEGCTYTISHHLLYADITGAIEPSTTGTTIVIDTLSTVTFINPVADFGFTSGTIELNGKNFPIENNKELEIFIADGTYEYTFTHNNSYAPKVAGTININGNDITENLNLYKANFTVKTDQDTLINNATIHFEELGLTVTSNTKGQAYLYLPNGTYNYTVTHPLLATTLNRSITITDANQKEEIIFYEAEFMVKADNQTPFKNALITIGTLSTYTNSYGEASVYLTPGTFNYKITHNLFGVESVSNSIEISSASILEKVNLYKAVFNVSYNNLGIENVLITCGNFSYHTNSNGIVTTYLVNDEYSYKISHSSIVGDITDTFQVQNDSVSNNFNAYSVTFNLTMADASFVEKANINMGKISAVTDSQGSANVMLFPGTYQYNIPNLNKIDNATVIDKNIIIDINGLYKAIFLTTMVEYFSLSNINVTIGNNAIVSQNGEAFFYLVPGTYTYTANSDSYVGEVSGSISIVDSNISEKVTLQYLRISVKDGETPLKNATIKFDNYPDLNFKTSSSGEADVVGIFEGKYAYKINYNSRISMVIDTIMLETFDPLKSVSPVLKETKVLLTEFITNYCTIKLNEKGYYGSTQFILPDGNHNIEIGYVTYFPIRDAFTRENPTITQNIYLSSSYIVNGTSQEPVNNATMTNYNGNQFNNTNTNRFDIFLFDNGFKNIYDFSAPGYKDTTVTIVTDLSDAITIQLTPGSNTIWHTVTFVDWNGTELGTSQVAEGKDATRPTDPKRAGYTFTGWDVVFTNVTRDLTVKAQYSISTDIKESEKYGVNIYPNPASNSLTIAINEIDQDEIFKGGIEIFNIIGSMVYKNQNLNTIQTIDVSSFQSGFYFVKVGNKITKVIKE